MTTAYSTINASVKYPLREEDLAHFIKTGQLPDKYREHIYVFFTEVSTAAIYKFMTEQGVTLEQLKEYYFGFVKGKYTNRDLEGMLKVE